MSIVRHQFGMRKDADNEEWITINGAHIMVDKNGNLQGEVGTKISSSGSKSTKGSTKSTSNGAQAANGPKKDVFSKLKDTDNLIKNSAPRRAGGETRVNSGSTGDTYAIGDKISVSTSPSELVNFRKNNIAIESEEYGGYAIGRFTGYNKETNEYTFKPDGVEDKVSISASLITAGKVHKATMR